MRWSDKALCHAPLRVALLLCVSTLVMPAAARAQLDVSGEWAATFHEDLAVPEDWQDGGTRIVPSHGRIADESDVVEYRDMVTIVGDRVRDLIAKGMTLAQVQAARPTFEYDRRYGATSGEWTTEMFVEAVYRDLSGRSSAMQSRDRSATGTAMAARVARAGIVCAALALSVTPLLAQGRGGAPGGPPRTPRAAAPFDLTGNWVSVVTEDWRWRMVVPREGDYSSVPLTAEGRKVADAWDPAQMASDGCKPFGAPALMRIPGRLRIAWQGDAVLVIEADAGQQTRHLRFEPNATPPAVRTWHGHSTPNGSASCCPAALA